MNDTRNQIKRGLRVGIGLVVLLVLLTALEVLRPGIAAQRLTARMSRGACTDYQGISMSLRDISTETAGVTFCLPHWEVTYRSSDGSQKEIHMVPWSKTW